MTYAAMIFVAIAIGVWVVARSEVSRVTHSHLGESPPGHCQHLRTLGLASGGDLDENHVRVEGAPETPSFPGRGSDADDGHA